MNREKGSQPEGEPQLPDKDLARIARRLHGRIVDILMGKQGVAYFIESGDARWDTYLSGDGFNYNISQFVRSPDLHSTELSTHILKYPHRNPETAGDWREEELFLKTVVDKHTGEAKSGSVSCYETTRISSHGIDIEETSVHFRTATAVEKAEEILRELADFLSRSA